MFKIVVSRLKFLIKVVIEFLSIPLIVCIAIGSRFVNKKFSIGLGAEPLINNYYHKQALILAGYTAETFVSHVYYITDKFDVRWDKKWIKKTGFVSNIILPIIISIWSILRYKCLFIYFNGACCWGTIFLWRLEPFFYKIAGIRTVVLPYGSDVQDMTRCHNLLFKSAMTLDYKDHKFNRRNISDRIDLWTLHASHIIGGCDWVDYIYHWDTLMIAHFCVDLNLFEIANQSDEIPQSFSFERPLKLLHAPNHRAIKGTNFIIDAVDSLKSEGYPVELAIVEKKSNEYVKQYIQESDVVIDQLIIGWYAMFAIEAMAMNKAVICNLRNDLYELYIGAGLLKSGEIPIIEATPFNIKLVVLDLLKFPEKIRVQSAMGKNYVQRHHSIESVGKIFKRVLDDMDLD
jgi:hypothetical protein